MDIDFYEVPGLNCYVCANEEAYDNRVLRMLGKEPSLTLFSNLNDHYEAEEVDSLNLYTTERTTYSESQFRQDLDMIESGQREKRNHNVIYSGLFGTIVGYAAIAACSIPLIPVALGAWIASNTYFSHQMTKEVGKFKENMDDLNVIVNDDLNELNNLYDDLDIDTKIIEQQKQYAKWGFFEKVLGPKGRNKTKYEKIKNEISHNYLTLANKAESLAQEHQNGDLHHVAKIYREFANGKDVDLVTPVVKNFF